MAAALVTGAVVGVLMVGLTGAGFRLCEVIQGAPSCGDPGFLLLLAIVIVVILVGKALLAAWAVPDPGSTSFLAVGLLCVVALLFLVDVLFNWWMIIVIPVLGMLCFALSHWVTTAFVDERRLVRRDGQREAAISSAICTVLRAAPLRRLSLLTNSARPRSPSTPGSWRIRPTYDGSWPAACSGVGMSDSSTPGAPASSSVARSTVSAEANSALIASE